MGSEELFWCIFGEFRATYVHVVNEGMFWCMCAGVGSEELHQECAAVHPGVAAQQPAADSALPGPRARCDSEHGADAAPPAGPLLPLPWCLHPHWSVSISSQHQLHQIKACACSPNWPSLMFLAAETKEKSAQESTLPPIVPYVQHIILEQRDPLLFYKTQRLNPFDLTPRLNIIVCAVWHTMVSQT